MFFVLFISHQHWLWEDNKGVIVDVNSSMVWFTVLPHNYSGRLLSFTWHFLAAAPDEIAVYHFACYASTLFHYVGHHIPLSCLTFSPQHHEIHRACFPKRLFVSWSRAFHCHCDLTWRSMLYSFVDFICHDVKCIQNSHQHDYDNHLFILICVILFPQEL